MNETCCSKCVKNHSLPDSERESYLYCPCHPQISDNDTSPTTACPDCWCHLKRSTGKGVTLTVENLLSPTDTGEKWEGRFDKKFITSPSGLTKSGRRLDCDPDYVKSFISSLLTSQKERIKKEVEGMKRGKVKDEDKVWAAHYIGYDEAISDILSKIDGI